MLWRLGTGLTCQHQSCASAGCAALLPCSWPEPAATLLCPDIPVLGPPPSPPVPQDLANPLQACVTSMIAFSLGALVPLLSGAFITGHNERVAVVTVASTVALALFGGFGAWAGGSGKLMGASRVVLGGLLAMGVTYAVGAGFKIAMQA